MHKNRDYWSKPFQSDRNHWEYGNNRLTPERPQMGWATTITGAAILAIAIFGLLFVPTN